MDVNFLDDVLQIQQDLRSIQVMVEALQLRLNYLLSQLQEPVESENGYLRFSDLEGLWAEESFSLEEIRTAEYKVSETL
jgi:hypothetical protein